MRQLPLLLLLLFALPLRATVYNIASGATETTAQNTINTASSTTGNTVQFAAATYAYGSTLNFPCANGTVYTGQPVALWATPTTIIQPTFTNSNAVSVSGTGGSTPGSGCTFEYFELSGEGMYIPDGTSGLLVQYNVCTGTFDGQANSTVSSCFYADYPNSGGVSGISYSTFQYNTLGPGCTTSMSSTTDALSNCGELTIRGANAHVSFLNNRAYSVMEMIHALGQGAGTLSGEYSLDLTIENNDCSNIHRICIEDQQTEITSLVIDHNSIHDQYLPQSWSIQISSANGYPNGSTSPSSDVSDNVIVNNIYNGGTSPNDYVPYGIEFWGYNSTAEHNLVQGCGALCLAYGIALGGLNNTAGSGQSYGLTAIDNTVQGSYSTGAITCEDGGTLPSCTNVGGTITYTPNSITGTVSAVASSAPTISPPGGSYTSSQTVTLTDTGTNHSIYYTTDGTMPVPGSGTTQLYTAPFVASVGTTVNAVGMWGEGGNPLSYPSGYGYVPSSVVSATYSQGITLTGVKVSGLVIN